MKIIESKEKILESYYFHHLQNRCVMNISVRSLVALSLLLLIFQGCGKKEEVQQEKVRPVKAIRLADEKAFGGRWLPGQAKAAKEANLSFRVNGTLKEMAVKVGDDLQTGTLLARLDPRDFQVALQDAEAKLNKAVSQFDLAELEYNRVARVYKKDPGAVSKSSVDVRKSDLETARAQVGSARAAVEKAKDNLNYTHLKAPFDGTVVERFVENFEKVQAMQQIIRLVNTEQIEFTVEVPETLMQPSDKVMDAFVVFDTHPDTELPAKVKEIGKEASKTTRTYPVTLIMDQAKEFTILPGMAGRARGKREAISKAAKEMGESGIEIPISALFAGEDQKKSLVWIIDEQSNLVAGREVEVVKMTETGALVKGLNPGEWIATAGVNTLVEGQKVRILP